MTTEPVPDPAPKSYTHALAVQFTVSIEGEDEQGFYDQDLTPITADQALSALIDAIGRTDSGMGFDADIDLEGDGALTTVHFEWEAGWSVPERRL